MLAKKCLCASYKSVVNSNYFVTQLYRIGQKVQLEPCKITMKMIKFSCMSFLHMKTVERCIGLYNEEINTQKAIREESVL